MSGDTDFDDVARWGAIMLGMILGTGLAVVLATESPPALLTLIVVGFLAWAGVRSGVLAREDDEADEEEEADPLATLQERYAAGELSEAEFERRLDRLLDSDRRAEGSDHLEGAAVEGERALERE